MIKYQTGNPAIITSTGEIDYNTLAGGIMTFAEQLQSARPERVVIFAENRPEWMYALYASWHIGAAAVPIDHKSNAEDTAYILSDCRPQVIVCSEDTRSVLKKAMEIADHDVPVIFMEDVEEAVSSNERPCSEEGDPDDVALIIYTSGTTGSPKGVMLTFANVIANARGVYEDVPIYTNTDRILVLLPLHHIFPLLGTVVIAMYSGSTAVFSPSLLPADIMKTLQTNKITMIIGVPRLYESFRKSIQAKINASAVGRNLFKFSRKMENLKLSRKLFGKVQRGFGGEIRYMISGGSKLDPETAWFFRSLGFDILEGFGMTEAAPMITFTRPGTFMPGSAGQRLPVTNIEIRDGEITASGPNIMKGYYNRPEETAAVLRDGWLYTGDLGHLDENGFLFITGRKKEILVLGSGKNINPVEIEQTLESLDPLVAEAALTVVDDRLHAIIRPDPEIIAREESVNSHHLIRVRVLDKYNRNATPHKIIQGLTVTTTELPRTSMGKLRRFLLDDLIHSAKEVVVETDSDLPESEEQTVIRDYLSTLVGRRVLPGDHMDSTLGMDSLDKVTFQVFLKKTFALDIDSGEFSGMESIGAIESLVRERKTQVVISDVKWSDVLRETTHVKLPKSWITNRLMKWGSLVFLKLYFRLSTKDIDKLPDGPCIITPNHQSFMDGLLVSAVMRNKHFYKTYFYAKAKHVKKWWVKFIADRHNVIIMDIDMDLQASIQKLAEVLKQGKKIIIFPEGTRSSDGQMGSFRKTFAILSRELSVPIVPVTINGASQAMPPGSKFPKPFKRISIIFQDPVYPGDDTYESLTNRIREHVKSKLKL